MRITAVTAVACVSIYSAAFAGDLRSTDRKSTDIPAQELGSALQALAKERGFQVVFVAKEVERLHTTGIKGQFTSEEALSRLLQGTGFTFQPLGTDGVSIVPIRDSRADGSDRWSGNIRLAQASDDLGAGGSAKDGSFSGASANLEEIIVTAQKREQRLQDVPVPVTVLNAEVLSNTNRSRIEDYFTSIPGMNVNQGTGGGIVRLSIRGMNVDNYSGTSVAPLIDDVPVGASTYWGGGGIVPDVDPSDLARIEVLRGPQGALYGGGSIGGVLKFVTINPSTEEFSGRIQFGTNTIDGSADVGYTVRGSANLPLSDTMALRVSGYNQVEPGYIDNVNVNAPSKDVNEDERTGGRVAMLWRPSEDVTLKLSALKQRVQLDGDRVVEESLGDLRQNTLKGSGQRTNDVEAYSAVLNVKLGAATLDSLTGYNEFSTEGTNSTTGPASSVPTGAYLNAYGTEKISQELRLTFPVGERLEWMVGGFYTKEDTTRIERIRDLDPATGELRPPPYLADPLDSSGSYKEYAVFTNLDFKLTDRFEVQVGLRQARFAQEFQQILSGTLNGLLGLPNPYVAPHASPKDNALTYLLTPSFKLSPDKMFYARVASGYRTGTANNNLGAINPLPVLDPDETQNYELGFKASFFDRKLSVDTSVYYIDWKDPQFLGSVFLPAVNQSVAIFVNGGRATSQGVEFSSELMPRRGSKLTLTAAYNDAKFKENLPANVTFFSVKAGDRLPGTPHFAGSLAAEQDIPTGQAFSAYVGGSLSYVGSRPSPFANPQAPPVPSYTDIRLNGGVRYESWEASVYVNNVANRRIYLTYDQVSRSGTPFQPRTIGVNLTKTF